MSKLFNDYPETPNENSMGIDTATKNTESAMKLKKRMKKNEKLLKRLIAFQELKLEQDQLIGKNDTTTNKNSFFNKLGDGIVKSLPGLLIPVATSIIRSYFNKRAR